MATKVALVEFANYGRMTSESDTLMIVIVQVRWFRSKDGYEPYEAMELHSTWPKTNFQWLLDKKSLRPMGWMIRFAIAAKRIEHFAAVKHDRTACSLLMFSKSNMPTRRIQPATSIPYDQRVPEYMAIGTTFDPTEAQKMIDGVQQLGYRLLEFTWPELISIIHRRE